jgi:hypothetical protein
MFVVNICDPDSDWPSTENADAMIKWVNENCKSFETYEELDVSDFSMYHDTIYTFYFKEEKDANWFRMMWL